MLAMIKTSALSGIEGIQVTAEVDNSRGLPAFNIIGLGDLAVKEARDRVHGAIVNSGYEFPRGKITVNLSPASVRKSGSHYDMAIAIGVLISEGLLNAHMLKDKLFIGELSLEGQFMPVKGILPMIAGIISTEIKEIYVPEDNAREAFLITRETGISVIPCSNLKELVSIINGCKKPRPYSPEYKETNDEFTSIELDFSDVKGQAFAKEAIVTAVAGGHGILMVGSPGCGKSMLARRISTILPKMSVKESIETSMVYSLVGELDAKNPLITKRPFRTLGSRSTEVSIIGGGNEPLPGEISFAHNGILFVDEFLEFPRHKIELLRRPMEEKSISIMRRGINYVFPANFSLVAATNPCRCGYYGDTEHRCRCTDIELSIYRNRLSGPICDRIDIAIELSRIKYEDLTEDRSVSSSEMRERVENARKIQKERYKNLPFSTNSDLQEKQMEEFCYLGKEERAFLESAYRRYGLSPRRYHKILKIARTLADLKDKEHINVSDLAVSLNYTRYFDKYDIHEIERGNTGAR